MWRAQNAVAIAVRAESAQGLQVALTLLNVTHTHAVLLAQSFEHGSWADEEDDVRGMWAGLLASLYGNWPQPREPHSVPRSQLTTSQARNFKVSACHKAGKIQVGDWATCQAACSFTEKIVEISGIA